MPHIQGYRTVYHVGGLSVTGIEIWIFLSKPPLFFIYITSIHRESELHTITLPMSTITLLKVRFAHFEIILAFGILIFRLIWWITSIFDILTRKPEMFDLDRNTDTGIVIPIAENPRVAKISPIIWQKAGYANLPLDYKRKLGRFAPSLVSCIHYFSLWPSNKARSLRSLATGLDTLLHSLAK